MFLRQHGKIMRHEGPCWFERAGLALGLAAVSLFSSDYSAFVTGTMVYAASDTTVFTPPKLPADTFMHSPGIGYTNPRLPVSSDSIQYSSAVMFKRPWSYLQPGQNDFSGIDTLLGEMQQARDRGLQVIFHLIPYNMSLGVPAWYRNKTNDPGVTDVRGWCAIRRGAPRAGDAIFFAPNMDHPEYVPAIERVMNEFVQRFQARFPNDPNLLAWMTVGGAGAFGEWLNSISVVNCNDPNPTHPKQFERIDMPTLANARRLVDVFVNAGQTLSRPTVMSFASTHHYLDGTGDYANNVKLKTNQRIIASMTLNTHPFLYALSRGTGWRSSAIEEVSTQDRMRQWATGQPLFRDAWRSAIVDAEPARGGSLVGKPTAKRAILNYMLGLHMSTYHENSEQWLKPTPTTNGILNFLTHAGYRLTVDQVTATVGSSNVTVSVRIGNDGNAPPYDLYRIGVRLVGGSTVTGFADPVTTAWLPGVFNDVNVTLPCPPSGTYTLGIRVYDAANEQRRVPLAISAPGTDGWYAIGRVAVASSPPDTTPPTVSLTAPAIGDTVGGMVTLSATASEDVVAVVGVSSRSMASSSGRKTPRPRTP